MLLSNSEHLQLKHKTVVLVFKLPSDELLVVNLALWLHYTVFGRSPPDPRCPNFHNPDKFSIVSWRQFLLKLSLLDQIIDLKVKLCVG